ncbi:chromobox protein homolog 3-like [Contarinia nasturtii]|uniref:chromobox protein homolog 3-like n=1 Tax=Contarinia nasturtii TaxID=265458 RepID=UPI0012D415D3|nr:chromobox protein homolog 3-like [Contarinia nasturtii]
MDVFYDIEKIVRHRRRPDGSYEYFVKWKGYDSSANTWEPKENFESEQMIDNYHDSLEPDPPIDPIKMKKEIDDDETTNKKSRSYLKPTDLLPEKKITERNLVAEKVINIHHMLQNEKDLVALIQFKNKKGLHYVKASWANKHCPKLVIKFYESRICWRDKRSGEIVDFHASKA